MNAPEIHGTWDPPPGWREAIGQLDPSIIIPGRPGEPEPRLSFSDIYNGQSTAELGATIVPVVPRSFAMVSDDTEDGTELWHRIVDMFQRTELAHRAREERWRLSWRGRLDGVSLLEAVSLHQMGELPLACHLAVGSAMLDRLLERFRAPKADAAGQEFRYGALMGIDMIADDALGDRWELRLGRPRPAGDEPAEVIAAGTDLE